MEEVRQKSENTKWVKERIMRQNTLIKTENARPNRNTAEAAITWWMEGLS